MVRIVLFSVFIIAVTSLALDLDDTHNLRKKFVDFQQQYARVYSSEVESERRFEIFQENMKRNEELMRANPSATFGVTKFSDLSQAEFGSQYLMKKVNLSEYNRPPPLKSANATHAPKNVRQCTIDPYNFDWYECGACTGIYNQGQCGSCWAFSATETIESYWFLSGGSLTSLSMEQIVDCDRNDDGCGGGLPSRAYEYVQNAPGIEPYYDYPYTAENGQSGTCQFNGGEAIVTVNQVYSVNGEGEIYNQLSNAGGCCYHGGPVSVCVDASTWSGYTGGILTSCGDQIDHCVQAVGYANYGQNGAYWIIKNSWGANWGENGFIYLAIGENLCGVGDIATVVSVYGI